MQLLISRMSNIKTKLTYHSYIVTTVVGAEIDEQGVLDSDVNTIIIIIVDTLFECIISV